MATGRTWVAPKRTSRTWWYGLRLLQSGQYLENQVIISNDDYPTDLGWIGYFLNIITLIVKEEDSN